MKKKNTNKKIMMYIKNGDKVMEKNINIHDVMNFLDSLILQRHPISGRNDEKKK